MRDDSVFIATIDSLEAEVKTLTHDMNNALAVAEMSKDLIDLLKEENNTLRSERDYYRHELEKKI